MLRLKSFTLNRTSIRSSIKRPQNMVKSVQLFHRLIHRLIVRLNARKETDVCDSGLTLPLIWVRHRKQMQILLPFIDIRWQLRIFYEFCQRMRNKVLLLWLLRLDIALWPTLTVRPISRPHCPTFVFDSHGPSALDRSRYSTNCIQLLIYSNESPIWLRSVLMSGIDRC